ncbi:MAG: carbon storage regulator CsrA [Treponema sp.]|jgi:carbon storage regulator|nr:carbon storage regulator CsrA [Treponema sp.]
MLILSRKVDERIVIGDDISISIVEIRGDQVRIGVEAPKTVKVFRKEVFDAIRTENLAAARSASRLPQLDFGFVGSGLSGSILGDSEEND